MSDTRMDFLSSELGHADELFAESGASCVPCARLARLTPTSEPGAHESAFAVPTPPAARDEALSLTALSSAANLSAPPRPASLPPPPPPSLLLPNVTLSRPPETVPTPPSPSEREKLLPKRARPPKQLRGDDEPPPKRARRSTSTASAWQPESDEDENEDDEAPASESADDFVDDEENNGGDGEEVAVEWPNTPLEVDDDGTTTYASVRVNGVEYRTGDIVSLWPENWRQKTDGPIGEVVSLCTDGDENYVQLRWFYLPSETTVRGARAMNPRELFASDHIEEQAVEAIARKVTMKHARDIEDLDAYCATDGCYFYQRKWDYIACAFVEDEQAGEVKSA